MGSLPGSVLLLAGVLHWWPLLPGEHEYSKSMPLSLQFALIVFVTSIPAFAIGLFFVLAHLVRTRREKRTSSV